jgi:hypothetical protein
LGIQSQVDGDDAPAIAVTMRDERCSMVNIDPDSSKYRDRSDEGRRS